MVRGRNIGDFGYDPNTAILSHNRAMRWRLPVLLLLLALSAFGATLRLYLKDGTYQLVREYKVLPDRVRYLSAERTGEWEEVPLELVDLNRTKQDAADHAEAVAKEAKEDLEEETA